MSFPICCIIGLYETNEMDMRAFVTSCDKNRTNILFILAFCCGMWYPLIRTFVCRDGMKVFAYGVTDRYGAVGEAEGLIGRCEV